MSTLVVTLVQVAMVGSGAFACAAMHMMSQNVNGGDPADMFTKDINMWVYEEDYEVRGLWGSGFGAQGLGCVVFGAQGWGL